MATSDVDLAGPVLVLGGSGFLGSEICLALTRLGVRHSIYDRAAPANAGRLTEYVAGDIRDLEKLAAATEGHTAVIHLAAEWNDVGVSDSEYMTTNVDGTRNVAIAAERAGVERIVFTSSSAVYDFEDGLRTVYAEEDSSPSPPTLYGRTKVEGERILDEWRSAAAGRRLHIVRPSVIHGPGNYGNMYGLIRQVLSGTLVFPDDRTVVKSISYVENVASFCLHLMASDGPSMVANYCDNPPMTTCDLVEMIRRLGDVRVPLVRVPPGLLVGLSQVVDRGPGSVRDRFGSMKVKKFLRSTQQSNDRAFVDSGFRQPVTSEDGLGRTVAWVKAARRDRGGGGTGATRRSGRP